MSKIDDLDAAEPFSLSLNLGEVDLASVPTLKGTALEAVLKELQEDDVTWEARHHSHHSYRTHGTATW
jgi:hypothetical protein